MKTRHFIFCGLILALFFAANPVCGQSEPKDNTKEVMKFKLHYTQRVLEGIATENYAVIADHAKQLKGLSQQVGWQVRQTSAYQKYTADFVRTADSLFKAANEKNVDAATVAYFQMTVSCTTCHKYLRGKKAVGLNLKEKQKTYAALAEESEDK